MPVIYPFRTAFGDTDLIESVLVRMVGDRSWGWSESAPWAAPAYSGEWARGAFIVVRDWLAPQLVGRDLGSGAELQRALSGVKANYFAKASLDLAFWDLLARSRDLPLWQLIGGSSATVEVGADIGVMESLDALLAEVEKATRAGFKRLKLKYRPGWELDMVAAVREAHPDLVMHVDCNSAYTLDDLQMFRELDRFGLAMIEQPLRHDDLVDHARLQAEIRTPVCLDESIVSVDKTRKAIALGSCRWVNIKLGRVGGLTNAIAIHDLCRDAGIPCWVGGMLESAVGQSHSIALGTLSNFRYPSDIFPTSRFYAQDLGDPPITLSGPSQVRAADRPGIGCEPDPRRLEKMTVEMTTVP
jgi:o-succinylbenzoate synthase